MHSSCCSATMCPSSLPVPRMSTHRRVPPFTSTGRWDTSDHTHSVTSSKPRGPYLTRCLSPLLPPCLLLPFPENPSAQQGRHGAAVPGRQLLPHRVQRQLLLCSAAGHARAAMDRVHSHQRLAHGASIHGLSVSRCMVRCAPARTARVEIGWLIAPHAQQRNAQ